MAPIFTDRSELLNALMVCYRSLIDCHAPEVANGRLSDLIRRLYVFDLSLVRLDIRQDASRHSRLLNKICLALGKEGYSEWSEENKLKLLISWLNSPPELPEGLTLDSEDEETLATFKTIALLPRESLGAYIISMAQSPADILTVELLQRITLPKASQGRSLRVVPLFEQVEDLKRAEATLHSLFSIPWYKAHISHHGPAHQEIMIGYSDSAKTAGRLSAVWELYRAQEAVVRVCRMHNVHFTLFHGRGGSISRGGGPTFLAVSGQPPGSIQDGMRVTEQGEMIQAKFGLAGLAIRNFELYTSAALRAMLRPEPEPKDHWRSTFEKLAGESEAAYREVIEKTPGFGEYFRSSTPEKELSLLNIGSRPARRASADSESKKAVVQSLRAIPWSFAWTQTRLHLPAWLGIDRAFQRAKEDGQLPVLREMYREWLFFRSQVDLVEMVLAKSDIAVAERYDQVLVPDSLKPLGIDLRNRLSDLGHLILEISGHDTLLADNAVLKRSIEVRNPYVDPINFMQVELLRKFRQSGESEELKSALLVTMNGIAAGMRNTG